MTHANFTHRLAHRNDLDALRSLMEAAIAELQKPFLNENQIASSRTIMGLDTQLIDDGTYFIVEVDGELAGCGGWSRRATLYGSDQTPGRSADLLDPTKDAARTRAMYTHPHHTRKGVGRLILALCEEHARAKVSHGWNLWLPWPAYRSTAPAAMSLSNTLMMTAAALPCRFCVWVSSCKAAALRYRKTS